MHRRIPATGEVATVLGEAVFDAGLDGMRRACGWEADGAMYLVPFRPILDGGPYVGVRPIRVSLITPGTLCPHSVLGETVLLVASADGMAGTWLGGVCPQRLILAAHKHEPP